MSAYAIHHGTFNSRGVDGVRDLMQQRCYMSCGEPL
jgi:hypothetical protein